MSKRAGKAKQRREERSIVKWGGLNAPGKTGSQRNDGKGLHCIPIVGRETDTAPKTLKTFGAAPHCSSGHAMKLWNTKGARSTLFWLCPLCHEARTYKPLRTGVAKASA